MVTVYCRELFGRCDGVTGRTDGRRSRAHGAGRLRRRLLPRGAGDPRAGAARRGAAERPRRGVHLRPPRAAPRASGCRSRTGTAAIPRSTTSRSTRRCSGSACPAPGSTALSFLLAQDPDVRYLRSWESARAVPAAVDGARATIRGSRRSSARSASARRHHVPTDVHGPMECLDLMALDFKSQIFQAFAQIPSYSDWLLDDADFTSTYGYERRVLKLLQWGEPPRPWRLKSPAHVLSLDHLDRCLPRRPVRDDPSRPDRRDALGRRRVRRHRRAGSATISTARTSAS